MKKLIFSVTILVAIAFIFTTGNKDKTKANEPRSVAKLATIEVSKNKDIKLEATGTEASLHFNKYSSDSIPQMYEFERMVQELSDEEIQSRVEELEKKLSSRDLIVKANKGNIEVSESNTLIEIVREQSALKKIRIQRRIDKLRGKI